MSRKYVLLRAVCACAAVSLIANSSHALTGYGVDANRQLFSFDVNGIAPAPVTNIGAPLAFLPEGIDFRPSSNTLYAIDVGPNTSQLYTIDINSGVATAVGAGFTSTGIVNAVPYDLTTSTAFGFDFNPKTLQARRQHADSAGEYVERKSPFEFVDGADCQRGYGFGDSAVG